MDEVKGQINKYGEIQSPICAIYKIQTICIHQRYIQTRFSNLFPYTQSKAILHGHQLKLCPSPSTTFSTAHPHPPTRQLLLVRGPAGHSMESQHSVSRTLTQRSAVSLGANATSPSQAIKQLAVTAHSLTTTGNTALAPHQPEVHWPCLQLPLSRWTGVGTAGPNWP